MNFVLTVFSIEVQEMFLGKNIGCHFFIGYFTAAHTNLFTLTLISVDR